MIDRLISLIVAVSLALLVWIYARSRDQETLDNVPVPVQVELNAAQAEGYTLEVLGTPQVLVSFTGSPSRIREVNGLLQRSELQVHLTVTVPDERLNEARYSDTLVVAEGDVHVPYGVLVKVVEGRNRVPIAMHRQVERRLPVRFDHVQDDPLAATVVVEPGTVLVRGPQEVLDRVRVIPTQPSVLPTRPPSGAATAAAISRVPLVTELEGRPIKPTPNRVTVKLPAQPRKTYDLTDVPVHFLCPSGFALRPRFTDERAGRISLKLQGPAQDEPPRVQAYIDLSRGRFVAGPNFEPVQLQLPRDFQLGQDAPRDIPFELVPVETPADKGGGPLP